jgi:hypothetical protein
MSEELGPFQDLWDAWNDAGEEIRGRPFEHFQLAAAIQFEEMRGHLDNGNREAAAREVVDLISIALNTMRWLGYQPGEIGRIARDRAAGRMRGRTRSILDKYDRYLNDASRCGAEPRDGTAT